MNAALESELARACKLLEKATPEAMDESAAVFERAVEALRERPAQLALDQARRLRAQVCQARLLLELAGRFHSRWRDILAGMAAGYTADGAPAEIPTRSRLSISG